MCVGPNPGEVPIYGAAFTVSLFHNVEVSQQGYAVTVDVKEAAVRLTVRLSELVRSTTGHHGGQPVKYLGDGVMCHFPRPADGVLAAIEMVDGARSVGLPPARVT